MKRIALQQFLPIEIRTEVKTLLKLTKANCGNDIYLRIKTELLDLFGQKPEDSYNKAKNRVMTGKPSQLGKAIMGDICDCQLKCACCARVVWGMYREGLPVVVRNHIAEMKFTKETHKEVFTKSDQVFDSNRASEPPPKQVAAVESKEVAAVQRSQKSQKNKNKGQQGQGNKSQNQNQNQGQKPKVDKTKLIDDDGLCRIHAKWKKEANFCAAPWGCKMKNVYKEPQ